MNVGSAVRGDSWLGSQVNVRERLVRVLLSQGSVLHQPQ